jgi:predicted membrane protein
MGKRMLRLLLRLAVFVVVCLLMGVLAGMLNIHLGEAGWGVMLILALGIYYAISASLIKAFKLTG